MSIDGAQDEGAHEETTRESPDLTERKNKLALKQQKEREALSERHKAELDELNTKGSLVTLCVSSVTPEKGHFPIEVLFPEGLSDWEKQRIRRRLELAVHSLGYISAWVPVV